MPTCSRGRITYVVRGTYTLRLGVKRTKNIHDSHTDEWNSCRCGEGEEYRELRCLTSKTEDSAPATGTLDLPVGKLDYDLVVTATREVTVCEYECVRKSEKKVF